MSSNKEPNQRSRKPMSRMMHDSSGRNNFDYVKTDNKNRPNSSEGQLSPDQTQIIQRQTNEAIKVATQSDNATNNTNKNPK